MSKLLASLMRNYFPKRPSGAPLHTLSKLYDVPVGFVTPPPLFWGWILLILRSPKGGCCSISDDLSCSYMRISGNERSSVILRHTKQLKSLKYWSKSDKTGWIRKGWCNKATKLQFQLIWIRKILMLSKCYESTEVDRRTWLHAPSGTHWSTSSDTHQVVEI